MMEFSATFDKLAKALILAQGNMGPVQKSNTNPAFKTQYAGLDGVINAVKPALQSQGIALIQSCGSDGTNVSVETMLLHESGEWMRSTLMLKPVKPDPQGIGSALTYARRYALMAMCGVAPEDDDGNGASGQNAPQSNRSQQHNGNNRAPGPVGVPNVVNAVANEQRKLANRLFTKLNYDEAQRGGFIERVCGGNDDGEAIRTWIDVVHAGMELKVIDSLQNIVAALLSTSSTERESIAEVIA